MLTLLKSLWLGKVYPSKVFEFRITDCRPSLSSVCLNLNRIRIASSVNILEFPKAFYDFISLFPPSFRFDYDDISSTQAEKKRKNTVFSYFAGNGVKHGVPV